MAAWLRGSVGRRRPVAECNRLNSVKPAAADDPGRAIRRMWRSDGASIGWRGRETGITQPRSCVLPAAQNAEVPVVQNAAAGTDLILPPRCVQWQRPAGSALPPRGNLPEFVVPARRRLAIGVTEDLPRARAMNTENQGVRMSAGERSPIR